MSLVFTWFPNHFSASHMYLGVHAPWDTGLEVKNVISSNWGALVELSYSASG